MNHPIIAPKKLIEVAMPLEAINIESLRRKQKAPKGWPSSFHKWWAQRPLAAARGVIFCQLVNDPSWKWELEHSGEIPPNHLKASWAKSRKRLFSIIEELVLWDNSNNAEVLEKARNEIKKSWQEVCELNRLHPLAAELFNPDKIPVLHDPFAGSGTIPLEAQRLGLEAYASDLNPVAVIINKAIIEIPKIFAGHSPVGPLTGGKEDMQMLDFSQKWPNATGLAEDIRRYGAWIRNEAKKRIAHLYPPIKITKEITKLRPDLARFIGEELTIIAWIWARTVKSPNPAFSNIDVPLASSFILSSKAGKEVYLDPIIYDNGYHFVVKLGSPPKLAGVGTSQGKRKAFRCLMSDTPIDYKYIRSEAKAGRMEQKLMCIVAEGKGGRVYLDADIQMESIGKDLFPTWRPNCDIPKKHRDFKPPLYGMENIGDLFTPRQLVSLSTFSDLVGEVKSRVIQDCLKMGMNDDGIGLDAGGSGVTAYAEAIAVYMACVLDRMIYYGSSLTTWLPKDNALRDCMPRQALAMTWDFAECNPFGKSSGDIISCTKSISNYLNVATPNAKVIVTQQDAASDCSNYNEKVIFSTDPPYYDNISYADLSDYFYVWLRRNLQSIFPVLFSTAAVPKMEELVAMANRHGSEVKAEEFFMEGMTKAMRVIAEKCHPALPITIYYAFKQSETHNESGTSSTGWSTFLEAVIRAGLVITGTWPMRTEGAGRMIAKDTNSLASSIVLVCRKRLIDAPTILRREFIRELNTVLPEALDEMTKGIGGENSPVAPVDLSQAIIGPGMAVFSKYTAVLEADGKQMSVRTALQLINRFLAEDDFDSDTQFCLHWFDQYGWGEGNFGDADTLSRAKGTSVEGIKAAGVIESGRGIVRLNKWSEYPNNWESIKDIRNPVWETLHHLIRALRQGGEREAGQLLANVAKQGESVRQLAYRLYTLCERKGWAEDARAYNELITSWTAIETISGSLAIEEQGNLFEGF